jgi:hypothetical protein
MHECDPQESGVPPIGRPLANTRVYVLDEQRQPVPEGVAGEIWISGAGVARGYLNRPELTAERFVTDSFVADPAARMYRTGDMGRWLPDGTIEFLGRNDFQVKIRGFRIELGEIEARLREFPGVREAVVLAREDTPGDKRLVAYYITAGEATEITPEGLRRYLTAVLPEHMVPAAYVCLSAFPLTPNGKVDRKGLPPPEFEALTSADYEPPQNETEAAIAAIWAEVLGVDRVGRNNNFFHLGGHSLSAVRVVSRMQGIVGQAKLSDLFANPRLSEFARCMRESPVKKSLPLVALGRTRSLRAPAKQVLSAATILRS